MDDCVIFDPGVKTYVGSGKPAPKEADRRYAQAHHRLYASYLEFCNDNNYGQFRRDRFVDAVNDIFTNQLKLNVTMSPTRILDNLEASQPNMFSSFDLGFFCSCGGVIG